MSAINYDLTKIKCVVLDLDGVLSPHVVSLTNDGEPRYMINLHDSYALQQAVNCDLKVMIVSSRESLPYRTYLEELGLRHIYMNIGDKLKMVEYLIRSADLDWSEVAYMGDDIPDLKCLRKAGLSCAPHDATIEVLDTVNYISSFNGGYGCVRDLLRQILIVNNKWNKI